MPNFGKKPSSRKNANKWRAKMHKERTAAKNDDDQKATSSSADLAENQSNPDSPCHYVHIKCDPNPILTGAFAPTTSSSHQTKKRNKNKRTNVDDEVQIMENVDPSSVESTYSSSGLRILGQIRFQSMSSDVPPPPPPDAIPNQPIPTSKARSPSQSLLHEASGYAQSQIEKNILKQMTASDSNHPNPFRPSCSRKLPEVIVSGNTNRPSTSSYNYYSLDAESDSSRNTQIPISTTDNTMKSSSSSNNKPKDLKIKKIDDCPQSVETTVEDTKTKKGSSKDFKSKNLKIKKVDDCSQAGETAAEETTTIKGASKDHKPKDLKIKKVDDYSQAVETVVEETKTIQDAPKDHKPKDLKINKVDDNSQLVETAVEETKTKKSSPKDHKPKDLKIKKIDYCSQAVETAVEETKTIKVAPKEHKPKDLKIKKIDDYPQSVKTAVEETKTKEGGPKDHNPKDLKIKKIDDYSQSVKTAVEEIKIKKGGPKDLKIIKIDDCSQSVAEEIHTTEHSLSHASSQLPNVISTATKEADGRKKSDALSKSTTIFGIDLDKTSIAASTSTAPLEPICKNKKDQKYHDNNSTTTNGKDSSVSITTNGKQQVDLKPEPDSVVEQCEPESVPAPVTDDPKTTSTIPKPLDALIKPPPPEIISSRAVATLRTDYDYMVEAMHTHRLSLFRLPELYLFLMNRDSVNFRPQSIIRSLCQKRTSYIARVPYKKAKLIDRATNVEIVYTNHEQFHKDMDFIVKNFAMGGLIWVHDYKYIKPKEKTVMQWLHTKYSIQTGRNDSFTKLPADAITIPRIVRCFPITYCNYLKNGIGKFRVRFSQIGLAADTTTISKVILTKNFISLIPLTWSSSTHNCHPQFYLIYLLEDRNIHRKDKVFTNALRLLAYYKGMIMASVTPENVRLNYCHAEGLGNEDRTMFNVELRNVREFCLREIRKFVVNDEEWKELHTQLDDMDLV